MPNSTSILHPIAISQVMINFAGKHGVDQDTCLAGTAIGDEQPHDADTLITREQELWLIENLTQALPDRPALGFELGLQYNVSTFGIFGFTLRTSRTLREAAQRALRYLPLSTAYRHFRFVDDAQSFCLRLDPRPIPLHLRPFLLERDMATALNILNELSLAGIPIQGLHFSEPTPDHAADIERLCGMTPQYGSARNMLTIRRENADLPLPIYDARLVEILEEQCRSQLAIRWTSGLTGKVREQVLGKMGLMASLEDVAGELALSPRSLRRKLNDEGTSFRSIVEKERKMLAKQLLQTSRLKLDEIALQLGYADAASFNRAFRRWFDQSPGEFRLRDKA